MAENINDTQRIEVLKSIERIEHNLLSIKSDVLHNPSVLKNRDVVLMNAYSDIEIIHKIIYDLGGFRESKM